MRRRAFIVLLGGAAAWPLAVRAQQGERLRRIGVLMPFEAGDSEAEARKPAFEQGLQQLGWRVGANLLIEYRLPGGGTDAIRRQAAELVALAPDVIVTAGSVAPALLLEATRTIAIGMANVAVPVGVGWVRSLARPAGNATGFMLFEYSLSAKWLELLKEIAPRMTRAAVLRDQTNPSGTAQFGAIQALAPSLGVQVSPINVRNANEIESGSATFARTPKGGTIGTRAAATVHRHSITKLAAQYKLPAIYSTRLFVAAGGLVSYGPDLLDQNRRAAGYVDRILKGEKPADLPVQAPTKYELVINLKTA